MRSTWLIVCLFSICMLAAISGRAQAPDSSVAGAAVDSTVAAPTAAPSAAAAPPPAAQPAASPPSASAQSNQKSLRDRVYFGGSVTLTFGDVTTIGIYPMIAYKFTPKLSLGLEAGYEYVKYDNYDEAGNNYGGSVFANYRLIPKLYAHAEYQLIDYEIFTSSTTTERDWVPFLLLGGGFSSRIGANTWTYVEVLFDVLQDENSPYENGEPMVSVGVSAGF